MTKEERVAKVTQTLLQRGFSKYESTRIAHEIVRNLIAYLLIQDRREAYFANLARNTKKN